MDLSRFHDEITFGVNGFYKHNQAASCQPAYYCLSPEVFFDGSDSSQTFLKELQAIITKSIFYIPLLGNAQNIVRDGSLPLERTRFIPHNGSLVKDEIKRVDLLGPIPGGVNIVQEAILVAFHLGCNPIYLLGVEHDFLVKDTGWQHFYRHFARHPTFRYFDQWTYYEKIRSTLQLWDCYLTIAKYAQQNDLRIINLTPGSYLDVFEMGSLEEVLR